MGVKSFFGGMLAFCGFAIAVLSGGCILLFSIGSGGGMAPMALMVGGIPFLLGLVLFSLGRWRGGRDDGPGSTYGEMTYEFAEREPEVLPESLSVKLRIESMPDIVFEVIAHDGPMYREAVRLREAVLRVPLGLSFSAEELAAEADHLHIVGLEGETVCATAVLVPEGKSMKMQRVAVAPELQGRGIGRALMIYCERVAREHEAKTIYVHARESAVPFYEKNWYVGDGELFDEDGIPHLKMWKLLV
ncbi:MAG: GNAT family N-acetyltransferase [Alphaproteobacteria bacterium]|nr:GNAT family N-acetyltransferase [Alphaproteobacteria bacterium]MBP7758004.1 GNAT family N-acetyltransferase [Alphaproteobacteria bacterium]MBP7761331.1 GNAT family N-acetyltransferase [Alphaproteobacteria bacterium]MBP7904885.1 GNAT family N-acetyltransferase [Alphaproteobacteria bacterium]